MIWPLPTIVSGWVTESWPCCSVITELASGAAKTIWLTLPATHVPDVECALAALIAWRSVQVVAPPASPPSVTVIVVKGAAQHAPLVKASAAASGVQRWASSVFNGFPQWWNGERVASRNLTQGRSAMQCVRHAAEAGSNRIGRGAPSALPPLRCDFRRSN